MPGLIGNSQKVSDAVCALIVMMLWGSLFPVIKKAYAVMCIDTGSISDILMFAALRFVTCGVRLHSYFNDNKRKDFKEQFAFMDNRNFSAFGRYYSVNCRCGDRCKNPVLQSSQRADIRVHLHCVRNRIHAVLPYSAHCCTIRAFYNQVCRTAFYVCFQRRFTRRKHI